MKNLILKSLSILFVSSVVSSCCGTRMSSCPDGRPVSFPKSENCANDIYQDAVKDFQANLKATVNVVDKVTIGIDNLDFKNESKLLKEKLNQESIRLQETLKASYLAITRDPCANSERHYKIVESVNSKNYELQQLTVKLTSDNLKEIEVTIDDYLYQRGRREGSAMGGISGTLDRFYKENGRYPNSLADIDVQKEIAIIGSNRLEYKLISQNEYSMKFAGEDYVLGSSDDKVYKGKNGKTERVD